MAFRILNEEELSLLTDEQAEYYQKELEIYKQREAFVEKLTKLENAEIKPYKPNLKSIDIIREIEFAPFISPERQKLSLKPMQKPELPDDLIGKASEKINISEVIKSNSVLKEQINFNNELFSKADNFRCYKKKQYILPEFSKPVIPDATFTKLENVLSNPVQIKKPAELKLQSFIAPVKNNVTLSKAAMPEFKAGVFVKPKAPKLDFAVNAKPETVIKPFEKTEFTLKAFPEVQKINVNMPTFQQPERNKPYISVNVRSDFKIGAFKMPEIAVADLPQIRKADVEIGSFQPPVQPKLDIKLNTVPDVKVKGFEKPEFESVSIPVIRKPDVSHIEFHAPEKREIKLSAVAKPSINVKPFKKPQDIKTELPELPKVNINIGSFTKPQEIKPKLNAQIKPFKPITNFKKTELSRPELSDIKVCKGFETGTEAQDILSMLNKETAL